MQGLKEFQKKLSGDIINLVKEKVYFSKVKNTCTH